MIRIILYCLIFSFLGSCASDLDEGQFELGAKEEFVYGNMYLDNSGQVSFQIVQIEDSRCPTNVNCIWEGEVRVWLEFYLPIPDTMVLSSVLNPVDTISSYEVKLISVSPYPTDTNPIELEDFSLSLKISALHD